MTDDEFEKLLAAYLGTDNPDMAGVEFDFNEGNGDSFGADHALIKHGVTSDDIS